MKALARINAIREYVNASVFERAAETEGILLSVLSGAPMFFYGSPGTAKTKQISLASRLLGLSVFDILLSPTTKPESVFGPIDVPALAKGSMYHKTAGYAPSGNVVFFDEIFKANGLVLDNLLWLVNERRFRNGDKGVIKCPIVTVFAASNEVPTESNLDAIYDRFVLRYVIRELSSPSSIHKMVEARFGTDLERPEPLSLEEVLAMQKEVRAIAIPRIVQSLVVRVRDQCKPVTGFSPSSRRLNAAFSVMQARAFLEGRTEVVQEDLEVLANIFWKEPNHSNKVRAIVMSTAASDMADLTSYETVADDVYRTAVDTGNLEPAVRKLEKIHEQLADLKSTVGQTIASNVMEKISSLKSVLDQRSSFIMIRLITGGRMWYKVTTATTVVWNAGQLRAAGFHFRKREGYWHCEGPKGRGNTVPAKPARVAFKNQVVKRITKTLGVTPTIQVMK